MRLAENALTKEIWPRPSVTRMLGNLISNCLLQRQFRAGGTLVTANMTKMHSVLCTLAAGGRRRATLALLTPRRN